MSDRDCIRKWLSDPYVLQLTFVVPGPGCMPAFPFSAEAADRYLEMLVHEPTRKTFGLEVNGHHVGNLGMKECRPGVSTAECFIEIGEGEYRGRGIGTAAMAILMDYAFNELELDEVRLEVLEFNNAAIRSYKRLGFVRTHRAGWHYDTHNQYWQVWGMCLTKDRWQYCRKRLELKSDIEVTPIDD